MTDKELKAKIIAEIERLSNFSKGYYADRIASGYKICCSDIISFINSLPDEPIREDLMSKIKKFTDNYFPIIDNGINIPARNELRDIFSEAARMGAQWQREKHLSNIDIDAIWGELVCRGVERLSRADVEEFVERLKEGEYDRH